MKSQQMKTSNVWIAFVLTLLGGFALAADASDPETVDATIGQQIAGRANISPELLRKIQANPAAMDSIVLVDARSDDEMKVSVIPGAITKAHYEKHSESYQGKTVVAYCLSGGRSGSMVRKLKAKGIPAVDLEGSILGWCAKGLPLVTLDGQPTTRVFTYDPANKVPPQYTPVY